MDSHSQRRYLQIVKMINWIVMAVLFDICFGFCVYRHGPMENTLIRSLIITFLFMHFYYAFAKLYDAFLLSVISVAEIIYSQTLSFVLTDAICYIVTCIILVSLAPIFPFVILVLLQFAFSMGWAVLFNRLYFKLFPARKTAVIYDMRENLESLIEEYSMQKKYQVEKIMASEECIENLDSLKDMEVVFLSGVHSKDRNIILKYCISNYIKVFLIPRVGDLIMASARPIHMMHLPMYRVTHYDPSPLYLAQKRIFDIVVAGTALILLSPVFLVTAIAIKATDGGPVFYKQERMTKGGRNFMIHKFRSMRVDAEKDGVARLSTGDKDDRITPVGHIIRKIRVDELPQLIDILKGDLAVVGPRPEREQIAAEYEKEIPEFRLRLQCKAGLTGYAQVYGKYNSTPYDKLQMDLMYIANPSILEDIRICFATVKILFLPESTDGIAEGATNALGK